ncbi:lysozyme inhibitor LprI family protein [Andreprevotia chitinilytica]|uniref:lysozyme inhibitor LprI family protein n=1 Tax=Andreprevotia chitinilytica TaxID=396808 RepID=UPI0014702E3C|nr:lysozyme inhibitor LprI family protein [Andreprevotia chitinilytica]
MTGVLRNTLLLALCTVSLSTLTHAASFDCDKAKTKVEHLICNDKALGELDVSLSGMYHYRLDSAADQDGLVQAQRDWLTQRNRCADAACLTQSYNDRMAALLRTPRAGFKTYRNEELGISFEYLGNRQVKPCPKDFGPRCVAVLGRGMTGSNYLIAFNVEDGPLEKVATDKAGFELQNGKWMTTNGPGEPQEVERFSGNGWKGMRATISCGVSDPETGYHAAGGECYWAVLSDGKRSVVADTQGIIGNDADTMRSVKSLRFER